MDAPLDKLPNQPKLGYLNKNDLQHEWESIQFMLDQGAYTSRSEIERACNRLVEIEELLDATT